MFDEPMIGWWSPYVDSDGCIKVDRTDSNDKEESDDKIVEW
jgi:hypothetical protein